LAKSSGLRPVGGYVYSRPGVPGATTKPVMENTPTPPNNFLNWVEIKNFKSIKDLRLDCKRVNVFIGKPNVGKSNILEALGLLGGNFDDRKYLNGNIRYEYIRQLFRDSDLTEPISVTTPKIRTLLEKDYSFDEKEVFNLAKAEFGSVGIFIMLFPMGEIGTSRTGVYDTNKENDPFKNHRMSIVKKYDFDSSTKFTNTFNNYLLPPSGHNLYSVIEKKTDLWEEFSKLFVEQKLEFILSDNEQSFLLQRKEGFKAKQYPFFSIADTFRRYMFYLTAIESNKDSVLIFEEPEVHSFPPYIKSLAQRMVSSETNQFFIATHSPYLLNTLIDELDESELSVFITYYRDYQTHVRALTADELREARDLGIDLFYNLSRYEPNA
jgi:AAA15 family ATPase/GTPase